MAARRRKNVVPRTLVLATAALAAAVLAPTTGAGDDAFAVIVNESNPVTSIARSQLDAMFLGKVLLWPDGTSVVPVGNTDATLRESFCSAIHARPAAAVAAYWAAKSFKEAVVPPAPLDDPAVIELVATTRGAIGFVSADSRLRGVKAVRVAD